jgi:hypothetical protein
MGRPAARPSHLENFTGAAIEGILVNIELRRAVSVGGTRRQSAHGN